MDIGRFLIDYYFLLPHVPSNCLIALSPDPYGVRIRLFLKGHIVPGGYHYTIDPFGPPPSKPVVNLKCKLEVLGRAPEGCVFEYSYNPLQMRFGIFFMGFWGYFIFFYSEEIHPSERRVKSYAACSLKARKTTGVTHTSAKKLRL